MSFANGRNFHEPLRLIVSGIGFWGLLIADRVAPACDQQAPEAHQRRPYTMPAIRDATYTFSFVTIAGFFSR